MSRHILIIDDTLEIAEPLVVHAARRGYDVATSGFPTDISACLTALNAEAVVIDCSVFDMSESLSDSPARTL